MIVFTMSDRFKNDPGERKGPDHPKKTPSPSTSQNQKSDRSVAARDEQIDARVIHELQELLDSFTRH